MSIVSIQSVNQSAEGWTSDRRIYLDKDGGVVEEGSPNKVTLLVAAGGRIPMVDAVKYGLVGNVEASAKTLTTAAESSQVKPEGNGTGEKEANDASASEGEQSEDLESLTVAKLKEIAAAEDVDLAGVTLKADIIAAIQLGREGEG